MDAASHVLCRMKYKYNDVSPATRGTNKISTAAILRFHNGTSFPHYVYRVGLFPYVVYLSCSLSAHGTNAAPAGAQLPTHTACSLRISAEHMIGILSLFVVTADVMAMVGSK
jgi:hypothetical protein